VLAATATIETTLFGFGWPARHRVVANAATQRWLDQDGAVKRLPAALNALGSGVGRVVTDGIAARLPRVQRVGVPLLAPGPPLAGMADAAVECNPLYAGETATRIDSLVTAAQAVGLLAGR
jgi:hypothetical protein